MRTVKIRSVRTISRKPKPQINESIHIGSSEERLVRTARRTGRRQLKLAHGQTDETRRLTWKTLPPGIRTDRKIDAYTEALVPGHH